MRSNKALSAASPLPAERGGARVAALAPASPPDSRGKPSATALPVERNARRSIIVSSKLCAGRLRLNAGAASPFVEASATLAADIA
jgi:hypothetical protein